MPAQQVHVQAHRFNARKIEKCVQWVNLTTKLVGMDMWQGLKREQVEEVSKALE